MITDRDIEKLKTVFATKEDLLSMEKRFDNKFATKEDLNRFATKDDVNNFATKEDLSVFSTKGDLKGEIINIKDDISHFKNVVVSEIQDLRNTMQNTELKLLTEMQNLRDDMHVATYGYGDRLEEHDRRLTKLETKCDITSD